MLIYFNVLTVTYFLTMYNCIHSQFECTKHNLTNITIVRIDNIRGQYTYYIQFLLLEGSTSPKIIAVMSIFSPRCCDISFLWSSK
jgi:hypothetical protein